MSYLPTAELITANDSLIAARRLRTILTSYSGPDPIQPAAGKSPAAGKGLSTMSDLDAWFNAALDGELAFVRQVAAGDNINKPHSHIFASMLRLASTAKGTGQYELMPILGDKIAGAAISSGSTFNRNDLLYQWTRAWMHAEPRGPLSSHYDPPPDHSGAA